MFVFKCNICGETTACRTGWLDRDAPTCTHCQSSVRFRSIVHLLTCELFGTSMTLADVPVLREIKGLGMTDWAGYADPLAARFSYVNTYYHKEPQFDITNPGPEHTGQYDFVISTEVFEHIQAPVARAFENAARLLKPNGFLILTVPYTGLEDETREHFPDLNTYRIIQLEDQFVLVNRRPDGVVETFTDLAFHGGPGTTLEMRLFAEKELVDKLLAAGFREVAVMRESYPEFGVQLPQPWSRPMVARKQRFAFPGMLVHELARAREEVYRAAQELRRVQDSPSGPATASESEARLRQNDDPLRPVQAQLQDALLREWTLGQQLEALQLRYSKLLEEHLLLQQQVAMAAHSRWCALGRMLGIGPRFG
jgi:SAM-dependent methyltransferase